MAPVNKLPAEVDGGLWRLADVLLFTPTCSLYSQHNHYTRKERTTKCQERGVALAGETNGHHQDRSRGKNKPQPRVRQKWDGTYQPLTPTHSFSRCVNFCAMISEIKVHRRN